MPAIDGASRGGASEMSAPVRSVKDLLIDGQEGPVIPGPADTPAAAAGPPVGNPPDPEAAAAPDEDGDKVEAATTLAAAGIFFCFRGGENAEQFSLGVNAPPPPGSMGPGLGGASAMGVGGYAQGAVFPNPPNIASALGAHRVPQALGPSIAIGGAVAAGASSAVARPAAGIGMFNGASKMHGVTKTIRTPKSDVKPICSWCHKELSTRGNLVKHIKAVHKGEKPFECGHCPGSFSERSGLGKHLQAVHKLSKKDARAEAKNTVAGDED